MRRVLFLCSMLLCYNVQAQNVYKIDLSDSLNESRLAFWQKGDYRVGIDMDKLAESFVVAGKQCMDAAMTYQFADSSGKIHYLRQSEQYTDAAELLQKEKSGFDLRKLSVFAKPAPGIDSAYNMQEMERLIRGYVKSGNAAVYYKGKRIYEMKMLGESYGDNILDHGTKSTIYYDDQKNFAFQEYQHLGW